MESKLPITHLSLVAVEIKKWLLCNETYGKSVDSVLFLLGLVEIIGDEDVVKDGSRLDLPEIETDSADGGVPVNLSVGLVLGVVDLWVDPRSLVCWVVDLQVTTSPILALVSNC